MRRLDSRPRGPKYTHTPPGFSTSSSSKASKMSIEGWWMVHTAAAGREGGRDV
jgi:hypothetical protein